MQVGVFGLFMGGGGGGGVQKLMFIQEKGRILFQKQSPMFVLISTGNQAKPCEECR